MASGNYLAGGDINPCRFVKNVTDFTLLECDANDFVYGVSQEGTRVAPIPDVTTTLAAVVGEQFRCYQDGEICLLQLGDTVANAGLSLKADSDGKGVPALLTGIVVQNTGAIAMQAGILDEKILVRVRIDSRLPANA